MNEILDSIKNVSFWNAEQLIREWHIPRRLANVIRRQPGYDGAKLQGYEMAVSLTKKGEWRLYARVVDEWMDASLHDMMADIEASTAAATLGRKGGTSTSEAKSAASRENGKRGGRPRKQE